LEQRGTFLSAEGEMPPWALMYRVAHGWPMIAGLPAPLFLATMLFAIVGTFGAQIFMGLSAVVISVCATAVWFFFAAWVFAQDRVVPALFFIRRRAPLKAVISSYNPSWLVVVFEEDAE
jgi:hypothetical protein